MLSIVCNIQKVLRIYYKYFWSVPITKLSVPHTTVTLFYSYYYNTFFVAFCIHIIPDLTLYFYLFVAAAAVVSDSVWPHRWQPTRLPRPWDSPGKNTGVGCHFLFQCMKVKSESEVTQSCRTPWTAAYQAPPHGIFQARVLEWVDIYLFKCLLFRHVDETSFESRTILYSILDPVTH